MNKQNSKDVIINLLIKNNYTYFKGMPLYHIGTQLNSLIELCEQLGNRCDDIATRQFRKAVDSTPFYCEFVNRFMENEDKYNRNTLLLIQMGDFVLNVDGVWHIIKLVTSDRQDKCLLDVDSLHKLGEIPSESWKEIHILFYSYEDEIFQITNLEWLFSCKRGVKFLYHSEVDRQILAKTMLSSPFEKSLGVAEYISENPTSQYELDLNELFFEFAIQSLDLYMDFHMGKVWETPIDCLSELPF